MEISIRFMYDGYFYNEKEHLLYRKGKVYVKDAVDPDLLSMIELKEILRGDIGMDKVKELWYQEPGKSIHSGLKPILIDKHVLNMVETIGRDKITHVYVLQDEDLSPSILRGPKNSGPSGIESPKATQVCPIVPINPSENPTKCSQPPPNINTAVRSRNSASKCAVKRRSSKGSSSTLFGLDFLEDEDGIILGSDSSEDDGDFIFTESDHEDDIFEDFVDHEVQDDATRVILAEEEVESIEEVEDNDESDGFISLSGSEGGKQKRYPEFNAYVNFKTLISLKVGMRFGSNDIFKRALKQFSIEKGGEYYYLHNDKSKVSAYCKYKCNCPMKHSRIQCVCKVTLCDFKACARRMGSDGTFQLKTFNPNHDCGWRHENGKVTSSWLAEKYPEHYREDPQWNVSAFIKTVQRDYKVTVEYMQAWRARLRAIIMTQGDARAQYARVWDYALTILKWNPGSSAFVKVCLGEPERPLFQRLYICLDACKKGFLLACRPIIGMDGCHLKGAYTGHDQWEKSDMPPPDPPQLVVQPGRPKKVRRREAGEGCPAKKRRFRTGKNKCSRCETEGHYKTNCTNATKAQEPPKPRTKGGRPKNPNTIHLENPTKRRRAAKPHHDHPPVPPGSGGGFPNTCTTYKPELFGGEYFPTQRSTAHESIQGITQPFGGSSSFAFAGRSSFAGSSQDVGPSSSNNPHSRS